MFLIQLIIPFISLLCFDFKSRELKNDAKLHSTAKRKSENINRKEEAQLVKMPRNVNEVKNYNYFQRILDKADIIKPLIILEWMSLILNYIKFIYNYI